MEAGAELNALIAEHLFGWQWKDQIGAAPDRQRSRWLFNPAGRIQDIPHYSTDIAEAWRVVEKMVAQISYENVGFDWVGPLFKPEKHYLTQEGYGLGTTCWYVRVEHHGYIKNICANTAPLAICLAALEVIKADSQDTT